MTAKSHDLDIMIIACGECTMCLASAMYIRMEARQTGSQEYILHIRQVDLSTTFITRDPAKSFWFHDYGFYR